MCFSPEYRTRLHDLPDGFSLDIELKMMWLSDEEATQLEGYEPKESARQVRDLFMAARSSDILRHTALDHPLAATARDRLGNTVAHVLALGNNVDAGKLVHSPISVTAYNDAGFTALHLLAMRWSDFLGQTAHVYGQTVQVHLPHGTIGLIASVAAKDRFGWTPAHWLAYNNVPDILDRPEWSANNPSRNLVTPLHVYALRGGVEVLKHPGASKILDQFGRSPLYILAAQGEIAAMKHRDVAVSAKGGFNLESPLHALAGEKCIEVLQHPEVASVKGTYGDTPLHTLAARGCVEILGHPLAAVVLNDRQETPVHVLVDSLSFDNRKSDDPTLQEMVEKILAHPKVALVVDGNGDTPLHCLARAGCESVLKHPEVAVPKNNRSRTPLHVARNRRRLWGQILKHPAVAIVKDNDGMTPLYYLAHEGFLAVLDHPDVAVVRNAIGNTPLHILARKGYAEALRHPLAKEVVNDKGETPFERFEIGKKERKEAENDTKTVTTHKKRFSEVAS